MGDYIKAGFTEIHGNRGQVDSAELAVEAADNSDNPGEREVAALVIKDFDSGDDLATVQLTDAGTRELIAALQVRLSQTYL